MKGKGRVARVGALIQEEVARLISQGIKDPRIGFVSVMGVRMSRDLRYANVYVSLMGTEAERKSSLIGLQSSAGWVRREVGKHLHMRVLPEIRFFPDNSLDEVYHLEGIFEAIHAEKQQQPMLHLKHFEVITELRAAHSFYLAIHQNPDGDAVGSMLALRLLLQQLGKTEIVCACADPIPDIFSELAGVSSIVDAEGEVPDYDLAVLIDCGIRSRTGALEDKFDPEKRLLILDHHQETGEPGSVGFIDTTYAATGELIAELYQAAEVPFTSESAACLYAAIASDTGCFRFSNTTARSHRLAAELMETGIDVGALNKRFFSDMSPRKFEIMRRALQRVELHQQGAVAISWLTAEDLEEVGATAADSENLINLWQNISGVEVSILMKCFDEGETRISGRSTALFNSADFMRSLGGGGHAMAAGATLPYPLEEARSRLLDALAQWPDSPWAG
ncbi:MAG: 30S ribosome-binding factor RbfA [Candidatus Hydrogenedens sp.]|jgi:phosphoesterase RecJ-like protein|nr:30S ribosome-binding factor RbfA [Candidatus Hydrogenedens sp.]